MAAKKIIIVDDDPDVLTVLAQRLAPCGYEISTAKDGEEAVAKVKAIKPDLIIMDVLMPKMTGYDALRKIREDAETRRTPAIMVSARGVMRDFFSGLPDVEFVPKPYDAQVLLSHVRRFLKEDKVAGEESSATPAAKSAAAAPASGPVKTRFVILLGVQDNLVTKIQAMLTSLGVEVDRALHEDEAVQTAQKKRPDRVFCQYWEDDKLLDAKGLNEKFAKTPALSGIPFYIYCESRSVLEAMKIFREERIVSYYETSDLVAKIRNVL